MKKVCAGCVRPYVRRPDDNGRCLDCQLPERPNRPTTAARGLGYRWRMAAQAQIRREPICAWCGSEDDLTADHIVPRHHGGTIEDGLQTLCRSCNARRRTNPDPRPPIRKRNKP